MARKTRVRLKLGEILMKQELLTKDQLEQALSLARGSGRRLGESIVEAGFCTDVQIAEGLAEQFGMDYISMQEPEQVESIDIDAAPVDLVRKHLILPAGVSNGRMKIIVHDPMDLELLDLLRFRLNVELDTVIAPRSAIKAYIDEKMGGGEAVASESLVTESIDVTVDRSVDASVDISTGDDDAPIVRLTTKIIEEAVRGRASDIHIEPMADRVMLRYRIDGVCHVRDNLPKRMQPALLARMKLMAGVNIAERRIPQDGRIKMFIDDSQVDFRVSCCPAYHGESVVLRILRPDSARIGLAALGFEQDHLDIFNKIIRRPNGIFLVTGPTGSGKTTTLYSALDVLNRPDRKIITAEDPIEYSFAGINQCQVNDSIGLTFPSILKSMLRQAPNVILIGEIRDREVADIAIQAALTGHLVFSTLHTNDAPSAITRLIDMGVKPYLAASSIQAVMAQRLARVLCTCKQPAESTDPKLLKLIGLTREEADGKIMDAVGCPKCNGLGYKGRQAIFEFMMMTNDIREMAFARAPVSEIRQAAIRDGMRDLLGDGRMKVLKGITTPSEVSKFAQAETLLGDNIDVE
ncbi:MAG: ATPase, T2SS/T4P/T4SS family [Phycisphaerales bacterium]|nr:ATPase, T2SS/T4P/T4SS family [Phycisphaerales bacterium]|tara:strand:- start:6916 stop:8649 length:1734 start_codon:yes stop_codon:yes gene_type:complete